MVPEMFWTAQSFSILGLQSISWDVADNVSCPRRLDPTMGLMTYSFVLSLRHGRHDVKCKPSIRQIRYYDVLWATRKHVIPCYWSLFYSRNLIVWANKAACKLLKTTFKLLLQQSNSKKYFLIYKYWYRVVNHKLPHLYIYTTKFCIYTYSSHQRSNHLSKPPVWGFADHFPWSRCRRFWPLWKVNR